MLTMMASAMLLSGCAATLQPEHWSKSGANQETFLKDYTACRNQTLEDQFSFYKGDPLLTYMETRGYKRDSNGDLFVPEEVAKNGFISSRYFSMVFAFSQMAGLSSGRSRL